MPNAVRIRKSLLQHGVVPSAVERILEGHQNVSKKQGKAEEAAFLRQVMVRLDALLDAETRHAVIDACACCKGGDRNKRVRAFAKETKGKALAEKVAGLGQVQWMGQPVLNADGTISTGIFWGDEVNGYRCPCPCFNGLKLEEPVSITYCHCCAGHFRYHYQNALGVKLRTKAVVSSVLESLGKRPCRFVYEIAEGGAVPSAGSSYPEV